MVNTLCNRDLLYGVICKPLSGLAQPLHSLSDRIFRNEKSTASTIRILSKSNWSWSMINQTCDSNGFQVRRYPCINHILKLFSLVIGISINFWQFAIKIIKLDLLSLETSPRIRNYLYSMDFFFRLWMWQTYKQSLL